MLEVRSAGVRYPECSDGKNKYIYESSVAHSLLFDMLEEFFTIKNPKIVKGKNGKPYIENTENVFFSISHTQGRALCALCDRNIGVDIEKISDMDAARIKRISKRFFTPSENKKLSEFSFDKTEFLKIWTRKEAYIKMLGGTISDLSATDTESLKIDTYIDNGYVISISKEE